VRRLRSLATERFRLRADRRLIQRFWDGITVRQMTPLLLAAFFTFASLGFHADVMRQGAGPLAALAFIVLLSGVVAVLYLYFGVRRRWWGFPVVIAAQVGLSAWASTIYGPEPSHASDALQSRLALDSAGAILCLAAGYGFFMTFISRQGIARVRTQAEIALAQDIHASLVPPADLETDWCEMHGRSLPASEVGGDLVDALVTEGRALGIVADVSGHGVPAGAVMGLVKASVRTRLRSGGDLGGIVADVNDVLAELTRPNTFVTGAFLALEPGGRLSYVLAGHPPILHRRAATGDIVWLSRGGLALGIRPGEVYTPTQTALAAGDVLAVLTDGFMETMDGEHRELGLEPLARELAEHGSEPLPALFDRLLALAQGFGQQQDDRTLLLVRVRPGC
jgi:hypothetical protein